MMTFREGAAGAVASARVYAGHLREQTLQKDMTDLARYYQRGADLNGGFVDPEVQAFAAAVVAGVMEMDDAVESLAASRIRGVRQASWNRPSRRERVVDCTLRSPMLWLGNA
jgi:hypothetical protein